jgi:hypothetical protein
VSFLAQVRDKVNLDGDHSSIYTAAAEQLAFPFTSTLSYLSVNSNDIDNALFLLHVGGLRHRLHTGGCFSSTNFFFGLIPLVIESQQRSKQGSCHFHQY